MKTVICFDTDDQRGMKDALKIIEHLANQYLDEYRPRAMAEKKFGKIQFIKTIRAFAKNNMVNAEIAEKEGKSFDPGGLKNAKQFADGIFKKETL